MGLAEDKQSLRSELIKRKRLAKSVNTFLEKMWDKNFDMMDTDELEELSDSLFGDRFFYI